MRASRLLVALLGLVLVSTLAPPVGADDNPPPVAETYAVVDTDDSGFARVVVACVGRGPVEQSARIVVKCDVYDSSPRPSIHHERSYTGFAGACFVNAFGLVLPVQYCATVTVQYRDLSEQTARSCAHSGEGIPDQNPPPPFNPKQTECLDVVGLPV